MDIVKIGLAVLGIVGVAFGLAVFGGTVVWLIWPVVGKAFPALVAQGVLSPSLSWWDSVSLTWLFALLIKSTQTNNKKS